MSNKLIYGIMCSIILPVIVLVNFKSAGAEPGLANIFSSTGIGFLAGFLIGLVKDRGETLKKRLVHMVDDRTEELARKVKELETSRKHTAVLRDLLPLCPACRNIRDKDGDWQEIATYLQLSSSDTPDDNLCPACSRSQCATSHQLGQQPAAG